MEEKLNGIVLSGVNYGENDRILNIFTLEKGVVSARIKGVKKAGAKLKFASEPFCFAEFIFSVSGEKRTVINASLLDSFYPIREDVTAFFCGGTALEFVKKNVKYDISSPELFFLLAETLKNLAYNPENRKCVVARFLLNGLKIIGYGLNVSLTCSKCGKKLENRVFFDVDSGSFFCENCRTEYFREINAKTLFYLNLLNEDKTVKDEEAVFVLRLLDFYLAVKCETNLSSVKELIKTV